MPIGVIRMAHGLIERPVYPNWIAATACASENNISEGASAPTSYDGAQALQRTVRAHLADDIRESHHRSL